MMCDLRNLRPSSGFIADNESDKMIDVEKVKNILRMYDELLASMLRSHDNRQIELPNYYVKDIVSVLGSCDDIFDE